MYTYNEYYKDKIRERFNLKKIKPLEEYVAECVGVQVPFNNYITGWSSFTHKVMNNVYNNLRFYIWCVPCTHILS